MTQPALEHAMNSTTDPLFSASLRTGQRRAWGLGFLLIVQALLLLAPVAILGPAIGWPGSLGAPAAQQLSRIAAAPGAVAAGYGVYLLYSLLIAPVMILLAARSFGGLNNPWAATVVAFAALSALARAIGILRWLTVMPVLATAHAGADPATQASIELIFTATTSYGGGIGEILGVGLLMAAALATLCVGAFRQRTMQGWLALLGLITAGALASMALPALGLGGAVPTVAAVILLTVWMLAAGVHCLLRRT